MGIEYQGWRGAKIEQSSSGAEKALQDFSKKFKLLKSANDLQKAKEILWKQGDKDRENLIKALQNEGKNYGLSMQADGKWGSWIKTFLHYHQDKPLLKNHKTLISLLLNANKKYNKNHNSVDDENALLYLKINNNDQIATALRPTIGFMESMQNAKNLSSEEQLQVIQARGKITNDGKRGPKTNQTIEHFLKRFKTLKTKADKLPKEISNRISETINLLQKIKEQHTKNNQEDQSPDKNFWKTIQPLRWKWIDYQPKNTYFSKATPELYKPSIKGSARKEKNEEKADTTTLSQKISKEQKTSSELSTTLSNIPIKSVETSIPKDQYQQAIHSFLQHKIANTDTIDIRFLVEQIANENGSGALYEKYSKMRNASPDKQRLLEQQRQSLQQEVKKQAESIAITTIKNSLKQMGVPIDQGNFVQDGRGGYVKFQDPTDPNINVFYRPSSGFISMRNFNAINPELKSVDTSGYHYHILSKMPSYQELIDQASDPLWLPNKRLSTQEEMKDHILDSLKSQITYNAGNIEQELMKEKISSTKRETNIIHQTKKLLGIDKPICSEQEQKAAYQILRQLWNSCKNLTFEELKKLNTFVNQLVSWLENSKNGTKNYQAEEKWPHIPNPKTPLELLTLITDQTSIQELKDHWGHQDMQQFGIGKLFARLSKPMPGKDEHYNIIDMQKLNLLLEYQESPEILRNPEHWKSYAELLKNTIDPYRKRAENQEQNIAQQQAQQAYNTIQLMPQQERGYA